MNEEGKVHAGVTQGWNLSLRSHLGKGGGERGGTCTSRFNRTNGGLFGAQGNYWWGVLK